MVVDRILLLIRPVFVRYLEAQWTVALHSLRFWSTDEYYRTVEYESNRAIGDADTLMFVILLFELYHCRPLSVQWVKSANRIAKIMFAIYLGDQWPDSVHTLRFGSTDEYFKTVEYEEQRSTELGDIERKPSGSAALLCQQHTRSSQFCGRFPRFFLASLDFLA